jgi:glycosyltransferase involved in cell wall biosynthesis
MTSNPSRLLVIIPALNEEPTIADVIARIPQQITGVSVVDVLVVDDGSTDNTVASARNAGADVISHLHNRGVGATMQTGLREAMRRGYDFVVNIDGDGQFDPKDIAAILQPVLDDKADFATASRFKNPEQVPEMPWVKILGNRWMSRIVSTIIGQDFSDVSCGFRAYSREAILKITLSGSYTYTQETFLLLYFHSLRIAEVPAKVRGVREHGKSRVASNLFKYAFHTLGILFSSVRDYRPAWIFNSVSFTLAFLGMCSALFFMAHWLVTGAFSPHIWSGFTAAFLIGLSFLLFLFGQIATLLGRIRLLQEEQVYYLRKRYGADPDTNNS